MSDHEALLEQFVSLTNTDREFARSFLEASDWKFDNALNLYLDGGGAAATSNVKIASQAPMPQTSGEDSALEERIKVIQTTQGVDYATAKAIAEAEGSQTETYEDGVRAPIAATTGRLLENRNNGFAAMTGGTTFRDFEAETRMMEARLAMGEKSIGTSAPVYNGKQAKQTGDSARKANLHDLFSPPREILFPGSFDQARAEGQKQKKWILINIQRDSEFLSYVFNRDLWSQEVIKDTIRNGFIFFQHEESDTEASRYITFYKPDSFPHIAIVDPLTGERMKVIDLSRFQNDPTDLRANFLEKLNAFLDTNKLDPPVLKQTDAKRMKKEQPKPVEKVAEPKETVEEIEQTIELPPEPYENDPDATLVQIRSFDGKRLRRRFKKQDKVAVVFAYVRSEIPEAKSRKFDLLGMRKSLLSQKESTLIEQKLINTLLVARWL